MRQLWFNRVHGIVRIVEETSESAWGYPAIGKLFGEKRAAAQHLMDVIDPLHTPRPGKVRVVETNPLKEFVLEIQEALGTFAHEPDPTAVKNAQALISKRSKLRKLAKPSNTGNEPKLESTGVPQNTLTVGKGDELDSNSSGQTKAQSTIQDEIAREVPHASLQKRLNHDENLAGTAGDAGTISEDLTWECTFHIAFFPTSANRNFFEKMFRADKAEFGVALQEVATRMGCHCEKGKLNADHLSISISIPPNHAPLRVVEFIKNWTAEHLAKLLHEEEEKIIGQSLWAPRLFISTIRDYDAFAENSSSSKTNGAEAQIPEKKSG